MSQVYEYRYTKHQIGDFVTEKPTPTQAAEIFRSVMRGSETESLWVMALDVKMHVIGLMNVANGTVSSVGARGAEIFRFAVRENAAFIVVAHYHVVDDSKPSEADIELTKTVINAGDLLGIAVLDHLVVTDTDFSSVKNEIAVNTLNKLLEKFDHAIEKSLEKEPAINDTPA